jgi:hypothetical protein
MTFGLEEREKWLQQVGIDAKRLLVRVLLPKVS